MTTLTEAQQNAYSVARSFSQAFLDAPEDGIELAAMQLYASLDILGRAYEGAMMEMVRDRETAFFDEEAYREGF